MGYTKQTIKGVGWMGALRASTRALVYVKIAILARLLGPAEFGLFGIASLSLSLLETLTETGINVFFIQGEGKLSEYINSAWVISIFRGFAISLILFLATPIISSFFNSPEATELLYIISIVPFLRGFINPAVVRFRKDLEFGSEFRLRLVISTIEIVVTIISAYLTGSALSLVYGMTAGVVVELLFSHILMTPRPRFEFDKQKLSKIITRGKWVTGAGIFSYLFTDGDDIVVGRLLEKSALGVYQMGYKISSLPLTEVSQVVQSVVFPVFSKLTEDKKRLTKAFMKSVIAVGLLVAPFTLIFLLAPDKIVYFVLGNKWFEAIPVIRTLAFFGVVRSMTQITYPLFLAMKKQEYMTTITFFGILGMAATIIPFVRNFGIEGAATSALIGALVSLPVAYFFILKLLR